MQYGIPYMGSKSKIADAIISALPSGKRFVDGGMRICSITIQGHGVTYARLGCV